jgi:hypothetical protein
MAIIQISKIQQRSGNLVDLPQLDEAQFGWATDAKRLFIGKTTPNENIEVLTSYSNISFSQIEGSDGGNFNIANATNGQTLTYVALTNSWENWTGNASQLGNAKLQLGDASNISIEGGATGYILETDGTGNLSWTSKGTLRTNIQALSNATPIIMTVANTTPYTNGLAVTISGANAANANTIVNGQTFYVKVANDFPTSGNVELYITANLDIANATVGTNLGVYTANSGIATALISGAGVANAGGSANTIQFNNSGILDGSANFTITSGNLVTLIGNFVANNVNGGNLVSANFLTGTLTTAAQPNITSTGTLVSLSVSGNANIGNIGTSGLITATGNIRGGNIITPGLVTATGNITGANLVTTGLISATGNANVANINVTGHIIPTANVTYDLGNSTNLFRDLYLSGTSIKIGSQSITSNALGITLSNSIFTTTLSASGNANIGNIGTGGLITATGNITGGNLVTTGTVSATGNGTFGNVTATTFSGALSGAATTAGTVTTAAQPNITSVGILTSVSVSGNANIGNIGTGGLITATGNVTAGNLVTGGVVSASGNATVLGIKTDNYYYANGVSVSFAGTYSNSNVSAFLAAFGSNSISTTGNVSAGNISASGNISAGNFVGTGIGSPTINSTTTLSISALSGVTINNITSLSTGSNTTIGTLTGNWSLTSGSRLQATYADLAEYYEADQWYESGTVLEFGGDNEVTLASDGTNRVAGVVTTNPAYVMNTGCNGKAVAIALQGRVPVKVRGNISKGDLMVSSGNGYARPSSNPTMGSVIGKALQNFKGVEGVIEIAVGRL